MPAHFSPTVLASMIAGPGLRPTIDAGVSGAVLAFFGGTQPAGGADAGQEQGRVVLKHPCGTVTGTVLDLDPPDSGLRMGALPITWARLQLPDGTWLMDLEVSDSNGAGQIQLDTVAGYPGGSITITAGSIGF